MLCVAFALLIGGAGSDLASVYFQLRRNDCVYAMAFSLPACVVLIIYGF